MKISSSHGKQLFHLTSFPLHVSQWSDEAQVFTTDAILVSFDEEIALDNFTFIFFWSNYRNKELCFII